MLVVVASRGLRQSHNGIFLPSFHHRTAPSQSAAAAPDLPAQGAEDEVHDEEGAAEDEGDEVDPRPRLPHRVVDLRFGSGGKGGREGENKRKPSN